MKGYDDNINAGLYVSYNREASWEALPIPGEIESVKHVHVDSLTGKIYIACGLRNGSLENGGVWVSLDKGSSWNKIFYMPLAFRVITAPYDPSRIAATVGPATVISNLNPGAYISFDSGDSWVKADEGSGQPDRITDLQFDLEDPELLWGSGW